MADIVDGGMAIHTSGELPAVGVRALDFRLVGSDLKDVTLRTYRGKTKVLNIVLSLDTRVCAISARKFNERAASLPNAVVLVVSADLPFAMKRFLLDRGASRRGAALHDARARFCHRLRRSITDGPMEGITARAVVVIDAGDRVVYTESSPTSARSRTTTPRSPRSPGRQPGVRDRRLGAREVVREETLPQGTPDRAVHAGRARARFAASICTSRRGRSSAAWPERRGEDDAPQDPLVPRPPRWGRAELHGLRRPSRKQGQVPARARAFRRALVPLAASGRDNLRFFARLYDVPGKRINSRIDELLRKVDLHGGRAAAPPTTRRG